VRLIRALLAMLALLPFPAAAQVVSPAPESVGVTIYRAPNRGEQAMDARWLGGYALITEKRRVTIPAGIAVIRFEGVAQGMLPESAIVTGLPAGVREKNMDADLLSPASLYVHGLTRQVTLRRTYEGKVTEEPAIIRSGVEGAAILETRGGFLAANCGDSEDRLVYDGVPAGLSAKPTLSVRTESDRTQEVTLTLSYLASRFDWDANYVATMHADGKHADLFAWVTLANGDTTSFADAETAVVAGKVERRDTGRYTPPEPELVFRCFFVPLPPVEEPGQFAPQPAPMAMMESADIVVTAQRAAPKALGAVRVEQEDLGDLKLYRVPHATTVASQSQKQVAMLDRQGVPVEILYRSDYVGDDPMPATIVLRAENRKERGLGVPLPAGRVAVFEPHGEQVLLVGEGSLADRAVNEDAEVELETSTQVFVSQVDDAKEGFATLRITNANPHSIRYELDGELVGRWTGATARRVVRQGRKLWVAEVPANGSVSFRFQEKDD
jgi:hypothetical protein